MRIPVFDLDWTLLKKPTPNIHDLAFRYALKKVLKINPKEKVYEGWIDNQILLDFEKMAGISEEEALKRLPKLRQETVAYFQENKHKVIFETVDGVREVLDAIKTQDIPMGVLTGNIEEIGWAKLENAGIKDYFKFGAFGNEAFKRSDLVGIARRRAQEFVSGNLDVGDMVVIGDTIKDVECAKDAGALSVAVAIRPNTYEELSLAKPDLLLRSFAEKSLLLDFLGSAS